MHLERQQEGEGDYVEVMKDDDTYFQTNISMHMSELRVGDKYARQTVK